MSHNEAVDLLEETLAEETHTDAALTEIVDVQANEHAQARLSGRW
jgi:ferritin-like metal-binding protein YciE